MDTFLPRIFSFRTAREEMLNGYGEVVIKLNDAVRSRQTITFGNSLTNSGTVVATHATKMGIESLPHIPNNI